MTVTFVNNFIEHAIVDFLVHTSVRVLDENNGLVTFSAAMEALVLATGLLTTLILLHAEIFYLFTYRN